jgi:hypothetical protein
MSGIRKARDSGHSFLPPDHGAGCPWPVYNSLLGILYTISVSGSWFQGSLASRLACGGPGRVCRFKNYEAAQRSACVCSCFWNATISWLIIACD